MGARVLIVGGGGREHVLAWKLSQSPHVSQLFAAPGSDAIAELAICIDAKDVDAWTRCAVDNEIDLVVVGPEAPLVDGVADRLRAEGIAVFGPSADEAKLEGDKAFAKEFMAAAGVATASSHCFDDVATALDFLRRNPGPWVVKATGLAAGKGVSVCDDESAAADAVKSMLGDRVFGDAGSSVLIEQRLVGPELSVFVVVDGKNYCWFAPSRDHKRLGDGDLGPNTGGMGAYTPVADASDAFMAKVDADILAPSVAQLAAQGFNYRGLLYVGLMLTPDGPMVLEYNCRFGDPETQVVLPTYDGDLFLLLNAAARGKLLERGQLARKGAAVGIVLAAANYPLTPRKGDRIDGLEQLTADSEIVFHAGTQRVDDRWLSAGGRVLTVVGQSAQLGGARDVANAASGRVSFDGAQRRNDIAKHETNNQ